MNRRLVDSGRQRTVAVERARHPPAPARDLPPLPFELEYRLIGRDRVLFDVPANMVVDVLDLTVPTVRYLDAD